MIFLYQYINNKKIIRKKRKRGMNKKTTTKNNIIQNKKKKTNKEELKVIYIKIGYGWLVRLEFIRGCSFPFN